MKTIDQNPADRTAEARLRRDSAAQLAQSRQQYEPVPNGEENLYETSQPTSFTKGLPHDAFGLVDREIFTKFRSALLTPDWKMAGLPIAAEGKHRKWESPLAGHYFAPIGPDLDAMTMPPAPLLGKSELCGEMAMVYAMALTRDLTFAELADDSTEIPVIKDSKGNPVTVGELLAELKKLSWFDYDKTAYGWNGAALNRHERQRRKANLDANNELTLQTLFRGSTGGSKQGPLVSQFMLIGTTDQTGKRTPESGVIGFGQQDITQQTQVAKDGEDYMTGWADWLNIQNGADTSGGEHYETKPRRVATPRDMATYVHFDQLYQAYLNACLIMLGNEVPIDGGNPVEQNRKTNTAGFATWGGPQILSLMTGVADGALRAVRHQKWQVHRRARPEVLAARLAQTANKQTQGMDAEAINACNSMLRELGHDNLADTSKPGNLLMWINQLNQHYNKTADKSGAAKDVADVDKAIQGSGFNYLLPMAFSEGSPMHPAYGAGHATVAGACVTILKAFFDSNMRWKEVFASPKTDGGTPLDIFEAAKDDTLTPYADASFDPTIAEELDKLASNISVGRNMGGVHYFSDYYDSVRLGERFALGVLEEQMLSYNETDGVPITLSFKSFDGDEIVLKTGGGATPQTVEVTVTTEGGQHETRDQWWNRDIAPYSMPRASDHTLGLG